MKLLPDLDYQHMMIWAFPTMGFMSIKSDDFLFQNIPKPIAKNQPDFSEKVENNPAMNVYVKLWVTWLVGVVGDVLRFLSS